MLHRAMDSLDSVEAVMVLEEVLDVQIQVDDAEQVGSPCEMVDLLEYQLSNERPTKVAADLLRGPAKSQNNPGLAGGLGGVWRREQIATIIRELF